MAHTKSGGSTKLGRDSAGKRLGLKKHDGEKIDAGQILIRQRGTKYLPGRNVKRGADDTLYAGCSGTVKFAKTVKVRFDGKKRLATVVNVL